MLKTLQKIEEGVSNIEAKLLIFVVVTMLLLAVYNVLYRNVLVPIQTSSNETHEKEFRAERLKNPIVLPEAKPTKSDKKKTEDEGFGGGFGSDEEESEDEGFGGGFGSDEEVEEESEDEGFGGGFGSDEDDVKEESEDEGFGGGFGSDKDDVEEESEDEGFGGGFGSDDEEVAEKSEDDGFGGGFGSVPQGTVSSAKDGIHLEPTPKKSKKKKRKIEDDIPYVEVPKTSLSKIIDAMKLDWIDILLRHLVLVVGFLGAMLATRRRKHITVDALSKAFSPALNAKLGILTNLLSMTICLLLANAGKDLVLLGLKFPKEIMSWANESTMQLVFPIGFGLLALHFSIRVLENISAVKTGDFSGLGGAGLPTISGGPDGQVDGKEEEE